MQTSLKVYIPFLGHNNLIESFGYTSKGNPGLEIIGLGKRSKVIKEKIIFLTKKLNLKIPLKRYVLCFDDERILDLSSEEFRNLELPILLLFWCLAGCLPMKTLDNCLASGKFNVRGEIDPINLTRVNLDYFDTNLKWITKSSYVPIGTFYFPLEELLGHIALIDNFEEQTVLPYQGHLKSAGYS